MIALSSRLLAVANYVKEGSRVADIGSDHAYLPVYLIQSGKAISAVAGELNKGPWQAARRHVAEAGLSDRIDVRLGNGLSVLRDGEVDTVCIAGMGGSLICSILDQGLHRLSSVQHVILQPNVAESLVREWLYKHGWELQAETMLKEEGIIYTILSAVPGQPDAPYPSGTWSRSEWFEIGPFLWREGSPLWKEKWEQERDKTMAILQGLNRAKSAEAEQKRAAMERRLKWMEEILECLPKDKP